MCYADHIQLGGLELTITDDEEIAFLDFGNLGHSSYQGARLPTGMGPVIFERSGPYIDTRGPICRLNKFIGELKKPHKHSARPVEAKAESTSALICPSFGYLPTS